MIIPDKKDPSGSLMGSQRRNDVLEALVKNKITIKPLQGELVQLSSPDDETIQTHSLPTIVSGAVIKQICRAFDIPLTDFCLAVRSGYH